MAEQMGKNGRKKAAGHFAENRSAIKRVLDYIGHYKWWVLVSLILAAVTVAATLYAPILVGDAVDRILEPGRVDFGAIRSILYRMAAVIAVTGAAQWLMNHINNRITYQVVKDIRTKAFDHLEVLPLRYIDSHPSGDVISRIISDIPGIYVCDQSGHRRRRGLRDAGVASGGRVYREEDLRHV